MGYVAIPPKRLQARTNVLSGVAMNGRTEFLDGLLASGCVLCESMERLQFHHIHPKGKRFTLREIPEGLDDRLFTAEVEKCVVLCGECHKRVHGNKVPPDYIKRPELFLVLQEAAKGDR